MITPRTAPALFAATGLLFALYAILRPYTAEEGAAGAETFASPWWVVPHVCAMIGFVLLPLAVRAATDNSAAGPILWVGAGLVLPYYGAETFALHAIGIQARNTGDLGLLELADPVRFGGVAMTMFGLGLILVAVGAVIFARTLTGAGSWVFAAGFLLFLPQFFAPAWLRIAHGVLVLVGCLLVAVQLGRARRISPVG